MDKYDLEKSIGEQMAAPPVACMEFSAALLSLLVQKGILNAEDIETIGSLAKQAIKDQAFSVAGAQHAASFSNAAFEFIDTMTSRAAVK